jgi:CRISPR-associated endonuclease/helicase Cas3
VYKVTGQKESKALASYVYDSFLLKRTEEVVSDKQTYEEKEFSGLVQNYFRMIETYGNLDKDDLMDSFKSLKFEEVATFQLIEGKFETVPIYIEYDDQAVQLREQFNSLLRNDTLEKFEKLASIKKFLQKMSLYTIEVRANREELTGALIVENGLIVITKDNLQYWYDDLTGFHGQEQTMIV